MVHNGTRAHWDALGAVSQCASSYTAIELAMGDEPCKYDEQNIRTRVYIPSDMGTFTSKDLHIYFNTLLKSHNLIGWNTLVQVEQVPYAAFAPKLSISNNSPCILADVYINVGEGIVDAGTLDGILNSMFYSIDGVVKEWKGTTVVRIRTHFRGEVGIYMYSASDDNDKTMVKEMEGELKRVQFQLHSLKSRL